MVSYEAMKRLGTILLASLVAAALAAGASAGKVSWNETAKNGKVAVVGFTVDSLTFGGAKWSAHVTIHNLSKHTIKIGNRFGAAIYSDGKTEDLNEAIGFAYALKFSPARPTALKPGASWTGTIGGDGRLQSSRSLRWARVVFGPLTGLPGQSRAVFWITDHALTLPPSGSGGSTVI
jgi:hypothetical protein